MNRKPIFDAVRKMLDRGFTQAEVEALDAACDQAEARLAGSIGTKKVPPGSLRAGGRWARRAAS